jgi:hypothetical protein
VWSAEKSFVLFAESMGINPAICKQRGRKWSRMTSKATWCRVISLDFVSSAIEIIAWLQNRQVISMGVLSALLMCGFRLGHRV